MIRSILILFIALITISISVQSQTRKRAPKILEGLWVNGKIGPNIFCGDIVDDGRWRFGLAASADREMQPWLCVRAEVQGGCFAGKQDGGISFNTTFFELSGGTDILVLNAKGYYRERIVDPYVGIGTGLLMFTSKKSSSKELDEETSALDDWRNIKTGFKACLNVYGLLGAKYTIDRHWGVNAEIKGNFALTDELDGHTGYRRSYYEDEVQAIEDEGYDIDPRGKWIDGHKDFFYTIMFGCTYKFEGARWKTAGKYNRKIYLKNRRDYIRNSKRNKRR